ncbi:hypothetical protein QBC34DRAFT_28260 [Podospora aff. communis PSN243]|uniref:Uncharacterized protein n=1 Tax=Podospora aff. communis PSN243 TaxID=3040156 RepID=A0AAV9GZB7_9PEZI|nr:hypothetical protein QBC34DRAFT_28260 [Podospora aff. communis PSN243]
MLTWGAEYWTEISRRLGISAESSRLCGQTLRQRPHPGPCRANPRIKRCHRSLHPPSERERAAGSACRDGILEANCEGSVGEQRRRLILRPETLLFFELGEGFSIHLGLCLATAGVGSQARILAAAPRCTAVGIGVLRTAAVLNVFQSGTGSCIHGKRSGGHWPYSGEHQNSPSTLDINAANNVCSAALMAPRCHRTQNAAPDA